MIPMQESALASGTTARFDPTAPVIALNPFASFAAEPRALLALVEAGAGHTLTEMQRELASDAGIIVASTGEPNINSLTREWQEIPELISFAREARRSFLPS